MPVYSGLYIYPAHNKKDNMDHKFDPNQSLHNHNDKSTLKQSHRKEVDRYIDLLLQNNRDKYQYHKIQFALNKCCQELVLPKAQGQAHILSTHTCCHDPK